MKIYLDNNVVSAIAKDDTATESDALDRLLAAYEKGKVDLVTSEVTEKEINCYVGLNQTLVKRTFRLLKKVPVVRWDELLGIHNYGDSRTWINSPMIRNEPLYDSFLKLGLKPVDAQHLFVAANQGCNTFLTNDGGILARASGFRQLCGLTVQRPSDLVAKLGL
jgi:predicted nucleic acid-binding protein